MCCCQIANAFLSFDGVCAGGCAGDYVGDCWGWTAKCPVEVRDTTGLGTSCGVVARGVPVRGVEVRERPVRGVLVCPVFFPLLVGVRM